MPPIAEEHFKNLKQKLDFSSLHTEVNDLSYLPNPSAQAGYDTRLIFKRSLTDLNSEFSFS